VLINHLQEENKAEFIKESKFDWSDVEPVPQYEGGSATILNLKYNAKCMAPAVSC
jgi:Na+-transporting NADH:ubiquinone oxidoreductase subunit NqrF